jgi:hypothetical protein
MSPELVDETILAHCKPQFRKVAKIIGDASRALGSTGEAALHFIAERIKALVAAERLEGAGDLDGWGSSEIRLPETKAGEAAAVRDTTDRGT